MRAGIPRDLEPYAKDDRGDGGLFRPVRNLRFSLTIISICTVIIIALTYYANPRPKTQRLVYYLCAFFLLVALALSIISFCLDVGKTNNARKCRTDPVTFVLTCDSRAAYGVAVSALDLVIAALALVCAIMLIIWTKDETFPNSHYGYNGPRDMAFENTFPEDPAMRLTQPGVEVVHKTLIFIGLLALFLSAILLLIITILIHNFREKVLGNQWDPLNGQSQAGWSRRNTRLRLSVSIIAILLCLLSLVPYPKRVYVYLLGFLFLCVGAMSYVIFGLDVSELSRARALSCPQRVFCVYDDYNATAAFDFILATFIFIYLLYEFLAKHKQSTVTSQRVVAAVPFDEFVPDVEFVKTDMMPVYPVLMEGPAMRPLLGIEVIEVEGNNGELNVTVMNVTPGGAAEEAQIRPGDIVAHWDEMPIHCKQDFAQAVAGARIGSTAMLQVIRQNRVGLAASTSVVYAKLHIRGVPA
jgi:membrane-associated protease RseP (regulator of RpoE activity)